MHGVATTTATRPANTAGDWSYAAGHGPPVRDRMSDLNLGDRVPPSGDPEDVIDAFMG